MTLLEQAIQKSQEVFDLVTGKFQEWETRVTAQIARLEAWKNNIIPELRVGRLYLEDKRHCISTNDGGGNFNIRTGVSPAASPVMTENGFGGTITFSQLNGQYVFLITPESLLEGEDANMHTLFTVDNYNVRYKGKILPRLESFVNGVQGYRRFDDGYMMQRGTVLAANGDIVNFPIAFIDGPHQCFANHGGTALNYVQIHIISNTQFQVFHNNASAINVQFVAFGK